MSSVAQQKYTHRLQVELNTRRPLHRHQDFLPWPSILGIGDDERRDRIRPRIAQQRPHVRMPILLQPCNVYAETLRAAVSHDLHLAVVMSGACALHLHRRMLAGVRDV